jgi:DNA-binding NarL/FixJ family response regulator
MNPITVLLVDDQELFAEGIKYVLRGESKGEIEVIGMACNGELAIELAGKLRPQVILMDIRMPVMDGVRATEIIHNKYPLIKIMILTTFDDDEFAFHALSAGARGYILKSVPPKELVLAVKALTNDGIYFSSSVGFKLIDRMKSEESRVDSEQEKLFPLIMQKNPTLTQREVEILTLVVKGKRNGEISEELFLSEKTVKNYMSSIYDKLGIHNRLKVIGYINELIGTS